MFQTIILITSALLILTAFFVFRKERKKYFYLTLKIIAILYIGVAFYRYILSDAFIWVINRGVYGGKYYEATDILQSILRWGHAVSYVVLPMACFFKNRLMKNISIYFCLPFALLSVIFFSDFITYFTNESGAGIKASVLFRQIYFCLELILAIIIPLAFIVIDGHYFNVKDKTEWRNFLLSLPFVILCLMPVYIPQSFIGFTDYSTAFLTIGNIIWLLITFLEIVILYGIFRFKTYKERYMLCMFLALALFMHYNSMFLMGFSIKRLPIQLCNMGAYFFVIALLIKKRAFFNFVFLANVMGTLIAMLMPDTEGGFAGFWNVHFLIEHMQVLVVPMLFMLLRIFPRLEKKALKHLVIGFTCYFIFCWVSGTILNAFAGPTTYSKVNFFYIFDIEKALEYFPFLSFATDFQIHIGKAVITPFFQLAIYLGFMFLCIMLYWVIMKLYDILDDHFELRKARIDIYEKLTGQKSNLPREYTD